MKLSISLPAIAGVLLAVLAGCQKRDAAAPTASASAPAAGTKIRVVYIPKNTGNPYFNGLIDGFTKGCAEQNVDFVFSGPATPDATSQIPFIEDQVQQGASVICISPNSVDALNAAFDAARAKGIKVICVNSDITGNESHRDAAVFPVDFARIGANQIELLGSQINYAGDFAILSATTDAPDQNFWIQGMKQALKDPKYAKMNLVDIVYGDDVPEKSRKEAEGLLTKYPNLRAILSPTTVGVEQAAKAVESAGVYPGGPNSSGAGGGAGVVVTGLGTPDQMRDYIDKGIIKSFALWSPPDEGYLASYFAAGVATGKIPLTAGTTFTVPGLGDRTVAANGVVITGPPTVFTKDNIGNYHF